MPYQILQGFHGSPTGSTVVEYEAGQVVELTPALAAYAVEHKLAQAVTPESADAPGDGKTPEGEGAEKPAKKPAK